MSLTSFAAAMMISSSVRPTIFDRDQHPAVCLPTENDIRKAVEAATQPGVAEGHGSFAPCTEGKSVVGPDGEIPGGCLKPATL